MRVNNLHLHGDIQWSRDNIFNSLVDIHNSYVNLFSCNVYVCCQILALVSLYTYINQKDSKNHCILHYNIIIIQRWRVFSFMRRGGGGGRQNVQYHTDKTLYILKFKHYRTESRGKLTMFWKMHNRPLFQCTYLLRIVCQSRVLMKTKSKYL